MCREMDIMVRDVRRELACDLRVREETLAKDGENENQ